MKCFAESQGLSAQAVVAAQRLCVGEDIAAQHGLCSHLFCSIAAWHMQEVLEAAGIYPSDTNTYATSEIEDALAKRWGAMPEVMCYCPGGQKWQKKCDTALIDSVSLLGMFWCMAVHCPW